MAEADVDSFLQIEAERGFPSGPETLIIARSCCKSGKEQQATLIAVPRTHIAHLEKVLKAAKLRPLSLTLGIAALQPTNSPEGALSLCLESSSVDLLVTCGGGISSLRSLESAAEVEGGQKRIEADVVAREIRISLGQLPAAFQSLVHKLKIFGHGDLTKRLTTDLASRVEAMGLKVELVERCGPGNFEKVVPAETPVSPALALAADYLAGTPQPLEFLPPKVHPWKQLLSSKVSSKKLGLAGGVVGGIAFCVCVAFLFQQWKISGLENRWAAMQPQVKELENSQKQIKRFRPWYSNSYRSLSLMKKMTEAFPEDGNVSAKTLEIRDKVTCSGTARDNQAFLKVLERLRTTKGITGLTVEQVRGQAPIQFTFNFQWEGEQANAN